MRMRIWFWVLAWLCTAGWAGAADLGEALRTGTIWREKEGRRLLANERGAWVEKDVRFRIPQPGFLLWGLPAGETLVDWSGGAVTQVRVSFYNRGDNGKMAEEKFAKLVERVVATLDERTGVPGAREKVPGRREVVRSDRRSWSTERADFLLECSESKEEGPEFARLTVVPAGGLASLLPSRENVARKARQEYREHVVQTADGTVEIKEVPMEDQGQKGYCAAAAVARLLRYYGNEAVDQHQVAQLVRADAQAGTDYTAMMDAIAAVLPGKFRLKVSYLEQLRAADLIEDYNKKARRHKAEKIELTDPRLRQNFWAMLKPEVLLDSRADHSQTRKWLKTVQPWIDRGVPVMWGVTLGLYPAVDGGSMQRTAQPSGHLRLIIGYNEKAQEVVYTDSWGAGHERKKMPLREAVAMTTSLGVIAP